MSAKKSASDYEELRLKNIADNKKILAEIGILNPFKPIPRVVKTHVKRKRDPTYVPERKKAKYDTPRKSSIQDENKEYGSESLSGRRRSSRIKGLEAPEIKDIEDEVERDNEADEEEKARRRSLGNRPMIFGEVPGVEVGRWWAMRIDCNHDNIHRPTVAGIHSGPDGAYSIALSGGYEDDIDMGDCFTYTGEGGRDLKGTVNKPKNLRTAPQSRDQWLSRGNAGLVKSAETGQPVRVIRGFKLDSPFAPEEGYRYDGLYKVEKYWYTTGLAGFGVYKFAFRRLENQAPPPWSISDIQNNNNDKPEMNKNQPQSPITEKTSEKNSEQMESSDDAETDSQDSGIDSQASGKDDADESDSSAEEKQDETTTETMETSENIESPEEIKPEETKTEVTLNDIEQKSETDEVKDENEKDTVDEAANKESTEVENDAE